MARSTNKKREPAIDEYLSATGADNRALLQDLRKTIHILFPDVEECISYRLPAFRLRGRIIAGFSATSKGCSYYPFSGTTLKKLAADLEGYSRTKSALHFGPERPLPTSLIRRLLKARIAEGGHPRPIDRRKQETVNARGARRSLIKAAEPAAWAPRRAPSAKR